MTLRARLALMPLLASLLWLVTPSIESARDVMELDLAFKNGRLQGGIPARRLEERPPQEQRQGARDAEVRVEMRKRHVPRRRGTRR